MEWPPVPTGADASHLPRRPVPVLLLFFGGLIAGAGVSVRVAARRLAWPQNWTYSGDRANTDWAFAEALYIDLGLVSLAFGLTLILMGVWRVTAPR